MFVLQLAVAAGCLVVLSTSEFSAAEQEAYFQMVDDCVAKEGASEADRNALVQRAPPTTPTGNCLYTCVMENIGLIKDGRFSVEGSVLIAVRSSGNDEVKVAAAKTIAEDCADVSAGNRCDLSIEILKCSANSAVARGLDPYIV